MESNGHPLGWLPLYSHFPLSSFPAIFPLSLSFVNNVLRAPFPRQHSLSGYSCFKYTKREKSSHTGNRTRIGRVRACYPNQLDYMGPVLLSPHHYMYYRSEQSLTGKSLLQYEWPVRERDAAEPIYDERRDSGEYELCLSEPAVSKPNAIPTAGHEYATRLPPPDGCVSEHDREEGEYTTLAAVS